MKPSVGKWFGLLCVTALSTIFQLYREVSFVGGGNRIIFGLTRLGLEFTFYRTRAGMIVIE
jgi:hypothetical protein